MRVQPVLDIHSGGFWDAASEQRLVVQRLADGTLQWPPRVGSSCGEQVITWSECCGAGTVWTFSVIHRSSHAEPPLPYVLAIVELDEGVRMLSNIVGIAPNDVRIGMRVRARFEQIGENLYLPLFEPEE